MNKKYIIFILVIIPLLLLVIGFSFDRTKYGTDPESAYLFNGLNVALFKSVGHYDHPGTTVHIFNAAILSITHFLRFTNTDLQSDVLTNSEYYIEVLRKSFIVLNSILLFLLGFVAYTVLNNIGLTLILQITPFLSATIIEQLSTKVSPEQLLFTTCMLMTILLLKYYSSVNQRSNWFAVLFGLITGFGLATKFTFLPLLIIPFVVLKGSLNKAIYIASIIPSFILFTIPAANSYKLMFKWFLSIADHTGIYGQGNKGIIEPVEYLHSLIEICYANKTLILAIVSSFVILTIIVIRFWNKKEAGKNIVSTYIFALFLALSGSILMVAKHYLTNHYLLPALSLTGLIFIFIYIWFEGIRQNKNKNIHLFSSITFVGVFFVLALINKPNLSRAYEGYRESNKCTGETMAKIDRVYKEYLKVYFYPGSFNQFAQLLWGNDYAYQLHTNALMRIFPNVIFYDVRDNNFKFWKTTIPANQILKKYGGHILLIGGPFSDNEKRLVEDGGLKLNKLFECRTQVVYEVDTVKSNIFKDARLGRKVFRVIQTDFETLSYDKKWIQVNEEQFCKSSALTNEKPRSGKYSFSMPDKDTFAMEYELKKIEPLQWYEVSIWRFGGEEDASLVVSAMNSELFYTKSIGTVENDLQGWSKITLRFRVPNEFKENMLKIYLWNHGDKPVWFDDFELIQYK